MRKSKSQIHKKNNYSTVGGLRTLNNNKKPLISIIIVTHNSERYIEMCLKSIFQQKFKNYEIIIIDNLSKDKTLKIIKKYEKKLTYGKVKKIKVFLMQ